MSQISGHWQTPGELLLACLNFTNGTPSQSIWLLYPQKKVFNDLGKGVLENAWKGYNCSLFAYGQTGAGKSYSIIGAPGNKGIVPMVGEELYNGIEEKRKTASKDADYQVFMQFTI